MEEVVYKDKERVDLVIFLNGLAIFAIELKLNSSGQSVDDAIRQLKSETAKIACLSLMRAFWLLLQ